MRIDSVTLPDISGKSAEEAVQLLHAHCQEAALLLMQLNNELEELKQQVDDFRSV